MTRAVFLDRDGTVIELVHHLADPADVAIIDGADRGILSLRAAGFLPVIVTNQSVIGRGKLTEEGLAEVHAEMNRQLGPAAIAAIYHCPVAPAQKDPTVIEHPMRKPGPGMLLAAAEDHGLDLAASWMVGDTVSDIEAGRNAGTGTCLVRTGYGVSVPAEYNGYDIEAASLAEAAELILNGRQT